jgi:hypothetical protein
MQFSVNSSHINKAVKLLKWQIKDNILQGSNNYIFILSINSDSKNQSMRQYINCLIFTSAASNFINKKLITLRIKARKTALGRNSGGERWLMYYGLLAIRKSGTEWRKLGKWVNFMEPTRPIDSFIKWLIDNNCNSAITDGNETRIS